jgi:hypothetical protein
MGSGNFARTSEVPRECNGFFNIPVLSAALPCPGVGTIAIIQAEGDNLRYRMDGEDPTSSSGMLLLENACIELHSSDLSLIRIIETTGGGSANITVFK